MIIINITLNKLRLNLIKIYKILFKIINVDIFNIILFKFRLNPKYYYYKYKLSFLNRIL